MPDADASISVIVPLYNAALYIAEAIQSILMQSYLATEIIVIDDGSTDDSGAAISEFGEQITYHRQSNQGTSGALNQGLRLAKGNYLAFLDADDRWLPNKLERQITTLLQNPSLDIVGGHVLQFISPELSSEEQGQLKVSGRPIPGYLHGALLIRSSSFWRVGEFNCQLEVGEKVEWYARAKALGLQEQILPDIVLERRLHQRNIGRRQPPQAVFPRILKQHLDRCRQQSPHGTMGVTGDGIRRIADADFDVD